MSESLQKVETLMRIKQAKLVAVVRGKSKEEAKRVTESLLSGGMKGIELTFTIPNVAELINELILQFKDEPVVIGAGTVLDDITARIAILAGAQFIVSPSFDYRTAELCNLYQVPYLPGCSSITEMKEALKSGVEIIKLFPSSSFSPNIINAIKSPLPQINIMPTGGINLENVTEWLDNGAIAVGVGGSLLKGAETGDFEAVTATARQYIERVFTTSEVENRV